MPVTDPFQQSFRHVNTLRFLDQFRYSSGNSFLLAIGKPTEWASESAPPASVDSIDEKVQFWQNLLAAKRIDFSDVSLVVPRYNWSSGVIFDAYRDNVDLFDDDDPLQFYVLVEGTRVYKCIDNYNGSPSTVAPTHTDSVIRKTSDNYRWKFLYSISENKRKFLTKDWMPVEEVTFIESNEDDRRLQYNVQNAAVPGSIDFIEIIDAGTTFDNSIPASAANQVAASASAGATSFTIGGSGIRTEQDAHNGFVIRIESGPGEGQQRVISDYTYNANSTGTVTFTDPLSVTLVNDGLTISRYSILPQVRITGNGRRNSNILNPYISSMEAYVKINSNKRITSVEIIDPGKDYSYASAEILPAGLSAYVRPVISPRGGHGSSPIYELGAATVMIATDLTQDELETVTVQNEYRQIGLILNPTTKHQKVYLRLEGTGTTHTFPIGYIGIQESGGGYTSASGYITEWNYHTTITGNNELVLNNLTGATSFAIGGTFTSNSISRKILDVDLRDVAGREGRVLSRIKILPANAGATFSLTAPAFREGYELFGRGITSSNISESRVTGKIYDYQLELGVQSSAYLFVDNLKPGLTTSENLWEQKYDYSGLTGPFGVVSYITESVSGASSVYDNTWRLSVGWDGSNTLTASSFVNDSIIRSMTGGTTISTGYIVDFTPATGGTYMSMRILSSSLSGFAVSHGLSYGYPHGLLPILSVVNEPDLNPYTGEIVYIQNIKAIERDAEQKEEIKLIIKF